MKQCTSCQEWKRIDDFYKNRNGHQSRCKTCAAKANKARYDSTRDQRLAVAKKYRKDHKNEIAAKDRVRKCSESVREAARKRYAANPEKYKLYQVSRSYGLTPEQYREMFAVQDDRCKICKRHQSEFPKAFAVDHCHRTGKIRGLLCNSCNAGLGWFRDNVVALRAAAEYVEVHAQ